MTMKAARVWMFVSPIVLGMAIWGIAKWSGGSESVENAVGKSSDPSPNNADNPGSRGDKENHSKALAIHARPKFDLNRLASLVDSSKPLTLEAKRMISGELHFWAAEDPEAALNFMDQKLSDDPERYRYYLPAILAGWAIAKPFEVMAFISDNPRGYPLSEETVRGPLLSAIEMDVDRYLEFARQFPAEWISTTSRQWTAKYINEADNPALLNYIESLPKGSDLKNAFLFGFSDALAAANWRENTSVIDRLSKISDSDENATKIRTFFALTAAWNEPVAVVDWVDSAIESPEERQHLRNTLLYDWAQRDVASYANWVNALPEERRTDDLIMKVIAPISSKDPVGALMWVQKVEDPNIRSGLAKEIRGRITSEDTKRDVESMIEKGQLSGEMFE